jgi:hypothetical protein
MKPTFLRICLAGAAWATGLTASEPAIIAKARAFLGTEAALDGVTSVHLVGSMESTLDGSAAPPNKATVDIVFQKPYQESLKIVTSDQLARKVLDGYNGWQLTQANRPGGPAEFDSKQAQRLTILGVDQIRILRADTWENLSYYRGLEAAGGSTEDLGPATIDGVACEKIALRHSDLIVYYRYFDLATGRLVFTETYAGAKIREVGELVVQGIRFPRKITVDELNGGKVAHTTIVIDRVTLNEPYSADFFAVPAPPLPMTPVTPAPAAPAAAAASAAAPSPAAAPKP